MKLSIINEGVDSGYGCIVFKNNKVLMINKIKNKTAQWQLPKGRPKNGESPEDAAVREVEEETGILCSILPIPPIAVNKIRLDKIKKNCFFYIAKYVGGSLSPQVDEGITQAKWIPIDKVINYIIPWQLPAIKYFMNKQNIKNMLN